MVKMPAIQERQGWHVNCVTMSHVVLPVSYTQLQYSSSGWRINPPNRDFFLRGARRNRISREMPQFASRIRANRVSFFKQPQSS